MIADLDALSDLRDRLHDELTAMWRRANGAPNLARYFTLQAHYEQLCTDLQLALVGEEPTALDDPYPLCPECGGSGGMDRVSMTAAGEPMDWDREYCEVCDGRGTLAPPYGEPVILGEYVSMWEEGQG